MNYYGGREVGCKGVRAINITEMGNPWPVAYREFAKASNT